MLRAARQAGLGGALRARLPRDHPWRGALREDAAHLALRHQQIRAEVRDLLRAWAAAGIPALLFKGFALAEFEYDSPAERFYGDVDLLLPPDPEVVTRAVHLALARGWRSDGLHARPQHWNHETAHLLSPGGLARLDVHRFMPSNTYAGAARAAAITRGLWQRARPTAWEDLTVLRPHPLDEVVVVLALGRSWGGDRGGLKGADLLDLHLLRTRHRLTDGQLDAHAHRIGASATWGAFRDLCSPGPQQDLRPDVTRPRIQAAMRRDGLRTDLRFLHLRKRAGRVPALLRRLPGALRAVLWAVWAVRRGGDPRGHLASCPQARPVHLPPEAQLDVISCVRLVTYLLHPRQRRAGVCLPRAYATYRALRRLGHPAVFVSGVARQGGQLLSHAWVEDDRGPLLAYGEPDNRRRFRVALEYPARP
ncbi:lasso peptide biosynthesis B2 protein [Deinococcus sp. JMULE3]|uniref:lasso peptide biosynthesis B2 protein n=1 Tax=Deinococcus sp. JMULE3 TaxID=2518341 RepID=UPI00157741AF|nr:lasso peptide biosynthesis B2 protein [Deinococcus sp. JMULE3]NTY01640.1 lasso peptide biosynthesis B2 protein [Deinococcus sp. JMULE3]